MFRPAVLWLVAAVLGLALTASAAHAAKGVKKNAEHTAQGTVVAVDDVNGSGFITIKAHQSKKKLLNGVAVARPHEHKFLVGPGTRFEFRHGLQTSPAAFTAVKPGEHVAVLARGDKAELVAINKHHVRKPGKKVQ